jgi:hypothetical protein
VTLRREATTFLLNASTDAGGDLATVLARAVLRGAAELPDDWTRLALDIRSADPHWPAKAVTLAALVLNGSPAVSEQDHGATLRGAALTFLLNASTDAGGDLATVLAHAVLQGAVELPDDWTRLALDIRGADPRWAAKAVTLAALVLESAQAISEQDDGKQGGGQR